jgi:LmbE family N-acetylglucosaminyl deacetylase
MKLFVLAFGAHPDDIELSCSGTLINEIKKGNKAGVIDLTAGELGTRGTAETRASEAALASKVMGLSIRENLGMRDGFFVNDEPHQLKVIKAIRKYQPEVVLANILDDRHPDHGRAGKLVSDACFFAGLSKIETIGDDGIIGPYFGCHPENHNFYSEDALIRLQGVNRKGINIGKNCWIGAKVTILDGVSIGENCIIAAGAVVTKSMPSNAVLGGLPAKVIKFRSAYTTNHNLKESA